MFRRLKTLEQSRILNMLRKVEGYSSLRKDVAAGGVVNVSDDLYRKNKNLREAALRNVNERDQLRNDVEGLKSEISEIKDLLVRLLDK
jgi:tRNA(Ile2) C34 agmatinyltransferase TiaS